MARLIARSASRKTQSPQFAPTKGQPPNDALSVARKELQKAISILGSQGEPVLLEEGRETRLREFGEKSKAFWLEGYKAAVEDIAQELLHHKGDLLTALRCLGGQQDLDLSNISLTKCSGCLHCGQAGRLRRRGPSRIGTGQL